MNMIFDLISRLMNKKNFTQHLFDLIMQNEASYKKKTSNIISQFICLLLFIIIKNIDILISLKFVRLDTYNKYKNNGVFYIFVLNIEVF